MLMKIKIIEAVLYLLLLSRGIELGRWGWNSKGGEDITLRKQALSGKGPNYFGLTAETIQS